MTDLISRTALVTGASRGIGRATASALAAAGARVIVHYGNAAKEAESLVAEIRAAGGHADAVGADLSAPDGAHKLAAEVRKLVGERLDIVVANAGVATPATIEDQSVAEFDRMFAVNVRAPFFLVQQLLPLLGEGSSVVLMSSLAARASVGLLPAYGATKGAIDTLVKHFAALLGPRGIRVNAVAPGVIDTDMSSFVRSDEGRGYTLGMQALQRIGHSDDVADVVAFLASDTARWVTGDTIQAGGGSKISLAASIFNEAYDEALSIEHVAELPPGANFPGGESDFDAHRPRRSRGKGTAFRCLCRDQSAPRGSDPGAG
jgi:3-oxoacyl-[acyl-carrier protein] reductase